MISWNSVLRYCSGDPSLIENYKEAFNDPNEIWHCHHRLEIMPFSKKECSLKKLDEMGLYYKQPPEALIFLTPSDHNRLHMNARCQKMILSRQKKRTLSEETKRKISEALKGKSHEPWNKGKKMGPRPEETKLKISATMKGGNSTSFKKGRVGKSYTKGKKRYTNGKVRIYAFKCPEGYWEGWK